MSKIIKIFGDKEIEMPNFTGKDFARLIVKSAKYANFKFPKGDVIIRLTTIDWYTSKYAFLIYSAKNYNDAIKEALLVPLPVKSINVPGILTDDFSIANNILNDDTLRIRLNRTCDYLNKKYEKTSKFFYDNTYSIYTSLILENTLKESSLKKIVKDNITLEDLLNVWKNVNNKAVELYNENKGNFSKKINPNIYKRNLSEAIYTDKCEYKDILKSIEKFKNSLRRIRHDMENEEYRNICHKISEIQMTVDKTFEKPFVCFIREN